MQTETASSTRRISRMSPDRAARLRRWGESLQARITKKDLNQSEFASRAAAFTRDNHLGRDLISNYIRGISEPTPLKQVAMAKALGISVEELMAPMSGVPSEKAGSPIEMKSIRPNRARLKIDMELPMDIAVQILGLINSNGK